MAICLLFDRPQRLRRIQLMLLEAGTPRTQEFVLDIRPTATVRDVLFGALRGSDPLLAPGILAVAGIIELAATYYHPALGNRTDG